jgi:hypothetical protein
MVRELELLPQSETLIPAIRENWGGDKGEKCDKGGRGMTKGERLKGGEKG